MNRNGTVTLAAVWLILFGLGVAFFLTPDRAQSTAERRLLARRPTLDATQLLSGQYAREMETYLLDQFPGREGWRAAYSAVRLGLYAQKDVNGIFRVGDGLYKLDALLKPAQVRHAAGRMNWVTEQYLQDSAVYYAVVPDKNVYTAAPNGYPTLDYDEMRALLHDVVRGMEYIDLWDCLGAEDYYQTDSHWRQERLDRVTARLGQALGRALPPWEDYTDVTLTPFAGVYQGQLALPRAAEALVYRTADRIEHATVTVAETGETLPVYNLPRFDGVDGYDLFLSGAQAVLTVECPEGEGELILFRDSFGSSLAPLLLGGYRTITLIDLRYVHSNVLDEYVDFHGQDVLFLYSTSILNSGMLLK